MMSQPTMAIARHPRPFRRPTLGQDGCVALLANGRRCDRPHFSRVPVVFTWDPVKGRGLSGPEAAFCRMHAWFSDLESGDRQAIVGGWFGRAWNPDAKVWTVMLTVFAAREGSLVAPAWWALRRETRFGESGRGVTWDEANGRRGANA